VTRRAGLALLTVVALTAALLATTPGPRKADAAEDTAGEPSVSRIAGAERVATSVELSKQAFDTAETVVLARADQYADALAGAPLAASLDAPVVLTSGEELHDAAAAEVARLGASRAYVLGGSAALSPQVADDLHAAGVSEVTRVAGDDRFATAAAVAERLDAERVYVTEGADPDPTRGWPDAVSVSALAAHTERPVLLTRSETAAPATLAAVEALETTKATIVGGVQAVSADVADRLAAEGMAVDRLAGATRYATSAAVARRSLQEGMSDNRAWLATGSAFADALAAGPAVAAAGGVLLIAPQQRPASARPAMEFLRDQGDVLDSLRVVGGYQAISWGVEAAARSVAAGLVAGSDQANTPVRLQRADSCSTLLGELTEAGQALVGPHGLRGGVGVPQPGFGAGELIGDSGGQPESGATGENSRASPVGSSASGTNVQVPGVDEPDVAKTNGSTVVTVLDSKRLRVTDITGDKPRAAGSLSLPAGEHELLVDGETALVLSQTLEPVAGEPQPDLPSTTSLSLQTIDPTPPRPEAQVTKVDISDPDNPRRVETLTLDGRYRSARMADGVVRLVLATEPQLEFVRPTEYTADARQQAAEANRQRIDQATIDDWLPSYEVTDGDGATTATGTLLECTDVSQPPRFSGLGTVSVLTLDPDSSLQPRAPTAVVADAGAVYASAETLYVATSRYGRWLPRPLQNLATSGDSPTTTELHAFSLAQTTTARYEVSGEIAGTVLGQFSLSERNGYLRVATTKGPAFDVPDGQPPPTESAVTVLEQTGGKLTEVGSVGGLGEGQRIQGVRFLGDMAAVVTFRRIDPLYLVDLSEPTAPQVTGELKMPGFSSYLHPVGEDRLLGIGPDATEEGRLTGLQVSLFDIADPARPQRIDALTLDRAASWASQDHRAFLYWPPSRLGVMPLREYGSDQNFRGALGLTVEQRQLVEAGRLSHPERDGGPPALRGQQAIRRSLVVDGTLYTVSHHGVEATDPQSLEDLGFAPFTQTEFTRTEPTPGPVSD
jgi:uncharacterized secreted protein with C-terminal beta-propeller domain/putative cell wall-binding protein